VHSHIKAANLTIISSQIYRICAYTHFLLFYNYGGDYMAQTEAQLRASRKYHEKFDKLQIRVPGGEKEAIDAHAAEMGESTNSFVRRAIAETMERDKLKAGNPSN
jgi:hypothetical protein